MLSSQEGGGSSEQTSRTAAVTPVTRTGDGAAEGAPAPSASVLDVFAFQQCVVAGVILSAGCLVALTG